MTEVFYFIYLIINLKATLRSIFALVDFEGRINELHMWW